MSKRSGWKMAFAIGALAFLSKTPSTNGTNCAAITFASADKTCVVFSGSPFLLTANFDAVSHAFTGTGISLTGNGHIPDPSSWTGIFTTQLLQTPAQIQTTVCPGGAL